MVDTMDPVSTKQETFTPPITTSTCGQALINLVSSPSPNIAGEPVAAPLELWLRSSTGASFPHAEVAPAEGLAPKKQTLRVEKGHAALCTLWQSGQAADTAGRLPNHGEKDGDAADGSAAEQEFQ